MKPLHKGLLGLSVVLGMAGVSAFAVVLQRSASAAPSEQTGSLDKAHSVAVAANSSPVAAEAPSVPCTAGGPEDKATSVPAGLKVTVKTTPKGRIYKLKHHGHVLSAQGAGERRTAMNELELPAGSGDKLAWETTDAKTLDTVRGELSWDEAAKSAVLGGAVIPAVLSDGAEATHACRAMGDGGSGFVVVCRVEGQAAATSVETKDPRAGVWSQVGQQTLVRFDLPMIGEGVDTKVIGLEKGGRGTLIRVEASRVAGEKEALLAIAADGRSQPQPVRLFGCVCRLPFPDRLL